MLSCTHAYVPKFILDYMLLNLYIVIDYCSSNIFQGTLIHRMVRGVRWLGAWGEESFHEQYLVNVKLNKFLFKL